MDAVADWELGISHFRVLVEHSVKKGVWPEESNMFIGSDKEYSRVSLQQTGKVQELTLVAEAKTWEQNNQLCF